MKKVTEQHEHTVAPLNMALEDSNGLGPFVELDRSRQRRAPDGYAITGLRCSVAGGEEGDVHDGATQPICRDCKSGDHAPLPCEANPHALAQLKPSTSRAELGRS
jgi:hypothetical protein